jgi:hypothetical protein
LDDGVKGGAVVSLIWPLRQPKSDAQTPEIQAYEMPLSETLSNENESASVNPATKIA